MLRAEISFERTVLSLDVPKKIQNVLWCARNVKRAAPMSGRIVVDPGRLPLIAVKQGQIDYSHGFKSKIVNHGSKSIPQSSFASKFLMHGLRQLKNSKSITNADLKR